MKITEKINFRQPKYMIPALVYLPIMFTGYFICGMIDFKPVETSKLESTNYFNDKLPTANIKGDGIGQKYDNMLEKFGDIQDGSAVENIQQEEEKKEDYESKYTLEELAALDSIGDNGLPEKEQYESIKEQLLKYQQEQKLKQQEREMSPDEKRLADLREALEAAKAGKDYVEGMHSSKMDGTQEDSSHKEEGGETILAINNDARAVKSLDKNAVTEEVVKKENETSSHFNTISTGQNKQRLIKAIVDENIKAVDGSRIRLRLLDDIDINDRTIRKGSYLYCTLSGFGQQRIKGNVTSVLVDDQLIKINLSLYDMDGLEGLYVPKSSFRETAKEISSSALDQSMPFNSMGSGNTLMTWGMQAVQNAYQKATNAISRSIRSNKVKIKYGTHVYLINANDIKNQ